MLRPGEALLMGGALAMLIASGAVGTALGAGSAPSAESVHLHAHAGALGWMTLGVIALASIMVGANERAGRQRLGTCLSVLTVVAVAVFVGVDAGGGNEAEAWSGAAALGAIVADVIWVAARWGRSRSVATEPLLAMTGALLVLIAGSVLGVLSAHASVAGELSSATTLASSHAAAISVPFVVLAATSIVEWSASTGPSMAPRELSTAGLVQVGLLVMGAAALFTGAVTNNLAVIEANVPLQIGGIAVFLWRVAVPLLGEGWRGGRSWLITCSLLLAAETGLFAHIVFEVARKRYVSIDLVPEWLLFVVDHLTYVGIGTTALFGAIAALAGRVSGRWQASDAPVAAGVVLGIAITTAGIAADSRPVETAGACILGLALLIAIVVASARLATLSRRSVGGRESRSLAG